MNYPLAGGNNEYNPSDVSNESRINLYVEFVNDLAILRGSAGCDSVASYADIAGVGAIRGKIDMPNGDVHFVSGSAWIKWDGNSFAKIYDIGDGSTPVSFATNSWHICVADGTAIYCLNLDTSVITVPSLPFASPTMLSFSAGLILAICDDPNQTGGTSRNQNRFWYSEAGPNGANVWGALAFYVAEGKSDPIIGIDIKDGEVALYGTSSIEFWRPTGDLEDPFTPSRGADLDGGCASGWSVATLGDKQFWLGAGTLGRNKVFMAQGYEKKPISNTALEQWLEAQTVTDDAIGFAHVYQGHEFYYLTFPTANRTVVYDVTTGFWHDRSYYNGTVETNAWRYRYPFTVGTSLYFFPVDAYIIAEMTSDSDTEHDGTIILREVVLSNVRMAGGRDFQVEDLTLVHESGMGDDASIIMYVSKDGARTWNAGRSLTAGQTGQYGRRTIWRKVCGSTSIFTVRFRMSAPVRWTLLSLDFTPVISTNR